MVYNLVLVNCNERHKRYSYVAMKIYYLSLVAPVGVLCVIFIATYRRYQNITLIYNLIPYFSKHIY